MTDVAVLERIEVDTTIEPPKKYGIVFVNDNKTSADFVVYVLMSFFEYSVEDSMDIALRIHNSSFAVVKTGLSQEIAEHISSEIVSLARSYNFPLVVEARPE
jgi:ATP-dependent Clp protease adaptor protein ClpS